MICLPTSVLVPAAVDEAVTPLVWRYAMAQRSGERASFNATRGQLEYLVTPQHCSFFFDCRHCTDNTNDFKVY